MTFELLTIGCHLFHQDVSQVLSVEHILIGLTMISHLPVCKCLQTTYLSIFLLKELRLCSWYVETS